MNIWTGHLSLPRSDGSSLSFAGGLGVCEGFREGLGLGVDRRNRETKAGPPGCGAFCGPVSRSNEGCAGRLQPPVKELGGDPLGGRGLTLGAGSAAFSKGGINHGVHSAGAGGSSFRTWRVDVQTASFKPRGRGCSKSRHHLAVFLPFRSSRHLSVDPEGDELLPPGSPSKRVAANQFV